MASPALDATAARALVDKYCVTCHNQRTKTANLLLDQLDLTKLGEHRDIAEVVVRKARAGLMPPTNMPRPDAATFDALARAGWRRQLDGTAHPHLPAPGLHRLNRTEYANAIRDLLALEVDSSKFLPVDDSTKGFDNIAGALTMSPALMEAYLSAAGKISRLAIGTSDGADPVGVGRAGGQRAEPSHRRAAVRHPRRHAHRAHVPGRRRIRLQRQGPDRLLPARAGRDHGREARDAGRRRARAPVRLGSRKSRTRRATASGRRAFPSRRGIT